MSRRDKLSAHSHSHTPTPTHTHGDLHTQRDNEAALVEELGLQKQQVQ